MNFLKHLQKPSTKTKTHFFASERVSRLVALVGAGPRGLRFAELRARSDPGRDETGSRFGHPQAPGVEWCSLLLFVDVFCLSGMVVDFLGEVVGRCFDFCKPPDWGSFVSKIPGKLHKHQDCRPLEAPEENALTKPIKRTATARSFAHQVAGENLGPPTRAGVFEPERVIESHLQKNLIFHGFLLRPPKKNLSSGQFLEKLPRGRLAPS